MVRQRAGHSRFLREHRTATGPGGGKQQRHPVLAPEAALASANSASISSSTNGARSPTRFPGSSSSSRIHRRSGSARSSPAACTSSRFKAPTRAISTATRRFSKQKCASCSDLRGVNSDLQISNPQVNVEIDRDKARSLGVSAQAIEDALIRAYGYGRFPPSMPPTTNIMLRWKSSRSTMADPSTLSLLYVRIANRTAGAARAPWSSSAQASARWLSTIRDNCPRSPFRSTSRPESRSAKPRRGAKACARDPAGHPSPPASRAPRRPSRIRSSGLGMLLLMAILVIYIVLGILYESFIHPITILSGLPAAGFGALRDAMTVGHAIGPVCLRRSHHAGRPGQEKRHHDDRLCARRAAHRGQDPRRGNFRRQPLFASGPS